MGGGRDGGSRYMHLSGLSRACVRSQVTKPAQRQRDLAKAWVQRILASDSTLVPATELGQERKVLGRHWVIVTNGKSFVSASCLLDNVTTVSIIYLLNLSSHHNFLSPPQRRFLWCSNSGVQGIWYPRRHRKSRGRQFQDVWSEFQHKTRRYTIGKKNRAQSHGHCVVQIK